MAKDNEIEKKFFAALGPRIQRLRIRAGYSQEDMISFGYGVRYWQRIEAGKPITLRTLLRICGILGTTMESVVRGLGPEAMKRAGEAALIFQLLPAARRLVGAPIALYVMVARKKGRKPLRGFTYGNVDVMVTLDLCNA